jgi:Sulfotransferase family
MRSHIITRMVAMANWPNFFIAGAPRCGTSSLHSWMQQVPGVFMARIKEPNFFSRSVIGDHHPMVKPIRDEKRYLQLFEAAGDATVIGEATPFYLEDPLAPVLISRAVPDAKVVVSLRDPVERLYSHYLMMKNNRPAMEGFLDEVRRGIALEGDPNLAVLRPSTGLYSRQVERYRRVFGERRFRVLLLEEWHRNVPLVLGQLLDFLGLENDSECGMSAGPPQRRFGEARGPVVRYLFGNRSISRATEAVVPYRLRKLVRNAFLVKRVPKPPMNAAAREFLVDYYGDDVRRLERVLGRSLPWRNFQAEQASRQVV